MYSKLPLLEDIIRYALALEPGDTLKIGKHEWRLEEAFSGQKWYLGITLDTPTIPYQMFDILAELETK